MLDVHPPAGNPSRIPAASVRESDRFKKELTESQFFQRSRYPGHLETATFLKRNPKFSSQMLLNACQGGILSTKGPSPWDPLPTPKTQQKSNRNSTAQTLSKKLPPDPQIDVQEVSTGNQNPLKPPKLMSGAGHGRASGKKHANTKSVKYLLCFKHIQALRASPEGIAKTTCKMIPVLSPKYPNKRFLKDPGWSLGWSQNP